MSLKIFDILGREIATLVNEEQHAGEYQVTFNTSELASGVYFYRLETTGFAQTRKLVVVR